MKKTIIVLLAILTIASCARQESKPEPNTVNPPVESEELKAPETGQYPKQSYQGIDSLFNEYSCNIEYTNLKTDLQKDSIEGWEYIEPRLAGVEKTPVNFGGKYILIEWGCGSDCQTGIIIDAYSGIINRLPTSERGLEYRPDSLLLIINPPSRDEAENVRPEYAYPAYYYLTEESKFILLHDTREEI